MNDKQSNKTLPHHVPIKSLMRTTTNMAPLKGLLRQKKQRHERQKEVVVNCSYYSSLKSITTIVLVLKS